MRTLTLILSTLLLVSCTITHPHSGTSPAPGSATRSSSHATPSPTGSAARALSWPVPNRKLTPGAIRPGCTYPVTDPRPDLSKLRKIVIARYHYTGPTDLKHLELDHFLQRSLCGADTAENLWAEPADGVRQVGFIHNRKDQLEDVLAALVRDHVQPLAAVQHLILTVDWRRLWCIYVHSAGVICDV